MAGPLSGVKVLAIEQMQAMPYGTQLMGWLGAQVIKIEPTFGEAGRTSTPALRDIDGESVGATYLRNNLGKQSVCINLKDPEGVELVRSLIAHFDVLAENYRPGTLDRLGIGYESVRRDYPGIIYASVSGFGEDVDSPYRDWPAYAPIVEAMAGFYELRRHEGGAPSVGMGAAFGDIGASIFAVIGILAALRARDISGIGQHVDVSMFDSMIALGDMISFMPSMGAPHPLSRPRGLVEAFAAKDGYFVTSILREHQFARLAALLGHDEWLTDERLASRQGWVDYCDQIIRPVIEQWASSLTKIEACNRLGEVGIAAGPSNTYEDLASDPHVLSHKMLLKVERPDSTEPLVVSGQPIKFSDTPSEASGTWPRLGANTDDVLRDLLGISEERIQELKLRGVVR